MRSNFLSFFFILLALVFQPLAFTQDASQPQNFPTTPQRQQLPGEPNPAPSPEEEQRAKIERDMAKKANQARQAQLKRDTDKLLQLSTELKQYVDKTNENVMSFEVIKKAEEIEKLAHSVKEKMKGS
ncbi:MAG TPA: hypothetical protein VFA74_07790 [Terriglobales bacterium]|nr:hypothetical protein [Terriglobales bacterium]